jgi:hypothetical protein
MNLDISKQPRMESASALPNRSMSVEPAQSIGIKRYAGIFKASEELRNGAIGDECLDGVNGLEG